MTTAWGEISLGGCADSSAVLEAALEAAGALSITLSDAEDEPILEPGPGETPLWAEVIVTGLFADGADLERISAELASECGDTLRSCQTRRFADEDWTRAWLADFHPMCFGARLWVISTVHERPTDGVILTLDPGLAFGTGTHPTTAMCLEWLAGAELEGARLLDYGCGSGILGIAAALLGARTVVGTDIDEQALAASAANARANGVPFELAPPDQIDGPFDVVVANILSGPLIQLCPQIVAMAGPGAHIVLTGILDDQADAVESAYVQAGCRLERTEQQDDWILHVLTMP